MRIVLSGIETHNKGAELMLYAILQEIERRVPNAEVFVPMFSIGQGLSYVKTAVQLKEKPWPLLIGLYYKLHLPGIMRRLKLKPYLFNDRFSLNNVDLFLDASGFLFSDQWNLSEKQLEQWNGQLSGYKKQGTRIIMLPQAFGPIEQNNTKKAVEILSNYATTIFAREQVSYRYLIASGVAKQKIQIAPDFTNLVSGVVPSKYDHLKDSVCVIPNKRMIDMGTIDHESYMRLIDRIIALCKSVSRNVFILNHEGASDEPLCFESQNRNPDIEVVTGLNALEVKGVISRSFLCISSRFHGAASALSSGVPCLATGWSHKYKALFDDYNMNDSLLPIFDQNVIDSRILSILDYEENIKRRSYIKCQGKKLQSIIRKMWDDIFVFEQM